MRRTLNSYAETLGEFRYQELIPGQFLSRLSLRESSTTFAERKATLFNQFPKQPTEHKKGSNIEYNNLHRVRDTGNPTLLRHGLQPADRHW